MKSVGILVNSLTAGGAERVASILATQLSARHKVYLLLLDDVIEFSIPSEVTVICLRSKNGGGMAQKILELPSLALQLRRLCKAHHITKLIALLSRPNYIACMSRLFGNASTILISERTCVSEYHKMLPPMAAKVSRALIKWLYPKADIITANAKYSLLDLVKNFGIPEAKTRVMYNPVAIPDTGTAAAENQRFVFLHLGALRPEKNHRLLLDAFSKMKDRDKSELWIVGKGPEQVAITQQIEALGLQEQVTLQGYSKTPEVFIRRANALVLSSDFEGFPNVLLEAMANGCPVISTDCFSGPREILAPESDFARQISESIEVAPYGILTAPQDPEALATGMSRLVEDKQLCKTLSETGRARAVQFAPENIAAQLSEMLQLN